MWTPSPHALATSRLGHYLAWLREHRGLDLADHAAALRWSVDDLAGFWGSFADWAGVRWQRPPTAVLGARAMPGTVWFPGATLNYADHALGRTATHPAEVAVVAHSQTRPAEELTWAQLGAAVARCRQGLRSLGVGRGDRVVAYAPNIPETLVAFLATASLGAVWSSCAPEFGVRAVVDRFSQIEPTVLLAVDGYRYGTREIDRTAEVSAVEAALPSLQHTIGVRYLGHGPDGWSALVEGEPVAFEPEPVPFDHPLYVLYTSGTTGLPKPIVHGHGGIVVEHLKVLALAHDLGPGDRFGWFTTTGWMMWNYLVSGLLVGATIALFDGDPAHPDPSTLWSFAAETGLDVFGVSAGFVMASRKAGVVPPPHRLRALGSTGSPLPPEGYRWIADALGSTVQPCSVSGGTDVCTAFLGSSPVLPVRAGEITTAFLGVDIHAFDPDGAACPPGVQGELVVTQPMPSMPVGLWGDTDGSRLRDTYFADYPGVWRHGDWITFFDDGASVISGRSDATLNRGGVRLGTADLYAVVEDLPEVADALVVHLDRDPADPQGSFVLFVVLAAGARLDDDLRSRIAQRLRTELSPRHVPDEVIAAPAVPRTLSGKKLEIPVKRILAGARADDVASRSSLADPAALDWYEALAASRR